MLLFKVSGPFEIHPEPKPSGARLIERSSIDRFWDEHPELAQEVGCYIFGLRASHGLIPVYVGQSKTGFRHECFQDHKLTHYHNALNEQHGTPLMFFVIRNTGTTSVLGTCVSELEHFLIGLAVAKNPELENVQTVDWGIHGFWRSPAGQPSHAARELRRLLSWSDRPAGGGPSPGDAEGIAMTGDAANADTPGEALSTT